MARTRNFRQVLLTVATGTEAAMFVVSFQPEPPA
jgi:hypothetical protein